MSEAPVKLRVVNHTGKPQPRLRGSCLKMFINDVEIGAWTGFKIEYDGVCVHVSISFYPQDLEIETEVVESVSVGQAGDWRPRGFMG